MGSNYKMTYNVDMVFCIDSTGSMENILDIVKNNALNFYADLTNLMEEKHRHVNKLRVRVISFRDYKEDGKDAMMKTDFFTLPDQAEDFERCVQSISAFGGGDDPEDGLEALAYAIKSEWNTEGTKGRQIIVVWSDAAPHPIGTGKVSEFYPKGMPTSLQELSSWWDNFMDPNRKRLLLYTPDEKDWSSISKNWVDVLHFPSEAGNGLQDLEYNEILNAISNSI